MFSTKVLSPDHLRTFDRIFKLKHTFCSSMILRSRYRLRDSLADLQWATFRCNHGVLGCYSISWKSYSPNLRYANPTFSPDHLRTLTKIMDPSTNFYFSCKVRHYQTGFPTSRKLYDQSPAPHEPNFHTQPSPDKKTARRNRTYIR